MIDLSPLFGKPESGAGALELRVFPARGQPRWLLEPRFRRPWHLETWPRVNRRARLIYRVARALGAVGLHLPSRRLMVPCAASSAYARLRQEYPHLGVFLGTAGRDRKIVVFAANRQSSVFVKIPTGPESEKLVENEFLALSHLQKLPTLAPMLPKAKKVAGHMATENMAASGARFGQLPQSRIAEVHDILFEAHHESLPLADLTATWVQAAPTAPTSPALGALLGANAAACARFLAAWPAEKTVRCYMAHGDFTRWNVLVAPDGTPQIIDWELYGLRPKYFDVIHYTVSSDILVRQRPAAAIMAHLREIGSRFAPGPDWGFYLGLYFLFQSCRYAPAYAVQQGLHPQAHWQLRCWTECLREATPDA